jgi:antitoxin ParD1/3/4
MPSEPIESSDGGYCPAFSAARDGFSIRAGAPDIDTICRSLVSSAMASLHISLSEPLREWVDSLVVAGDYSTPSEYVRELIRNDQRRKAEARLDALLLEGLESGDAHEVTPEFWDRMKVRVEERLQRTKG